MGIHLELQGHLDYTILNAQPHVVLSSYSNSLEQLFSRIVIK